MIGHEAPPNLVHVVLDNGRHDSTGSQPTTSGTTSFAEVTLAAGYRTAVPAHSLQSVTSAVRAALTTAGPHLIVVPTAPRTGEMPPRATSAAPPRRSGTASAARSRLEITGRDIVAGPFVVRVSGCGRLTCPASGVRGATRRAA
jgi:phosphonopyruvate decarboxylase